MHDHHGKLIFDRHPAKYLLRQDIKDGAYPRLSPTELWTSRDEFKLFDLDVFKGRIYQEIHRNKFINWCKEKRQAKKGKASARQERNYQFA